MDFCNMDILLMQMDFLCKQSETFKKEKNYFTIMVNGQINIFL